MVIKLLIAEDSAFQRKIISEMLSDHPQIDVCAVARNGEQAIELIAKYNPDVLLLDLIMPKMDGLETFKYLSKHYPIPTIIFSALGPSTLDASVHALLLGAFDYIVKPKGIWKEEFPRFKAELIEKVLLASRVKKTYKTRRGALQKSILISKSVTKEVLPTPLVSKETPLRKLISKVRLKTNIIVIGTSTGGPRTLRLILKDLPRDLPSPILVVQHMNEGFIKTFSKSLKNYCKINVKLAENDEKILPGNVYIAPGNKHVKIHVRQSIPCINTFKGQPVNFCIPSVDVLFLSAAKVYKNHTLGIILTGIGKDGAAGLKAIKNAGGSTIAESEETCIVYGMPKSAIKINAAKLVMSNYRIKNYIMKYASKK